MTSSRAIHRMAQILYNLERIPAEELQQIRQQAQEWRSTHAPETPLPE